MLKMLNCSNHVMGITQLEEIHSLGYDLVELPDNFKAIWGQLTPDNYLSTCDSIISWAEENGINAWHLAGFPAAVTAICIDIKPTVPIYYAYSERIVKEIENPDGSVTKKSDFRHKGFYLYTRIPQKKMN